MTLARIEGLFDQLSQEMLSLRIALAQERDGILNPDELTAMLEVYAEFGR